jgi:hypothetical protein
VCTAPHCTGPLLVPAEAGGHGRLRGRVKDLPVRLHQIPQGG